MELRQFGSTDMQVSPLGLGGGRIGSAPDDEAVERFLNLVLDLGVNVIDTAACYGRSEERIGRFLSHRRDEFFVFTKCGHATDDLPGEEWSPDLMERSIERSLSRLQTDRVDLLQLHTCSEDLLRRGDVIEVVQRAREAGKVRYVGYSGDGSAALCAVECGRFDALQTSLNIADQQPIDLTLPVAMERGPGVICKRPIANALWLRDERPEGDFLGPYWDRLKALKYPFLAGAPATAVATALRFTLYTPGVSTAIAGTRNLEHFERNLAAVDLGPLPSEEYEAIRQRWADTATKQWGGRT